MYKTSLALVTATVLTLAAAMPASASMSVPKEATTATVAQDQIVHKTKKRRGRFAAGLVLGLGAAAALSHGGYYYDGYSYRHQRRCRRLRNRCWHGNHRACWKFDRRC